MQSESLKVPKRENFSIAFFAQSEPIWICDVGTSKTIEFFYQLTPDFVGFWIFAAVHQKKFESRPKLKVGGGCF
jgi:hypothetical protein